MRNIEEEQTTFGSASSDMKSNTEELRRSRRELLTLIILNVAIYLTLVIPFLVQLKFFAAVYSAGIKIQKLFIGVQVYGILFVFNPTTQFHS